MTIDLQKSEEILDAAGKAIKSEVNLSGKDWKKIAGVLLSTLVVILGLCGTAIWVVAKAQYQSFKDADLQNERQVQSIKRDLEAKSAASDVRIKKLEDAILRIDINMEWVKGYVQAQETARASKTDHKPDKAN